MNGVGRGHDHRPLQAHTATRRLRRVVRRHGEGDVPGRLGAAATTASTGSSASPARCSTGWWRRTSRSVEAGGNGFEGDNNENGFDLAPRSNPRFCNVTLLGTRGQAGTPAGANQDGLLLRRGTAGLIAKVIVAGFHKAGVELQHATPACGAGPALTGNLLIRDSLFFDNGGTGFAHCASGSAGNAPSPCNGCEIYDLLANGAGAAPDLCGAGALGCQDQTPVLDPTVPRAWPPADPRPTSAPAVASSFDCSTLDPAFGRPATSAASSRAARTGSPPPGSTSR